MLVDNKTSDFPYAKSAELTWTNGKVWSKHSRDPEGFNQGSCYPWQLQIPYIGTPKSLFLQFQHRHSQTVVLWCSSQRSLVSTRAGDGRDTITMIVLLPRTEWVFIYLSQRQTSGLQGTQRTSMLAYLHLRRAKNSDCNFQYQNCKLEVDPLAGGALQRLVLA